jgi:hypothetical protein
MLGAETVYPSKKAPVQIITCAAPVDTEALNEQIRLAEAGVDAAGVTLVVLFQAQETYKKKAFTDVAGVFVSTRENFSFEYVTGDGLAHGEENETTKGRVLDLIRRYGKVKADDYKGVDKIATGKRPGGAARPARVPTLDESLKLDPTRHTGKTITVSFAYEDREVSTHLDERARKQEQARFDGDFEIERVKRDGVATVLTRALSKVGVSVRVVDGSVETRNSADLRIRVEGMGSADRGEAYDAHERISAYIRRGVHPNFLCYLFSSKRETGSIAWAPTHPNTSDGVELFRKELTVTLLMKAVGREFIVDHPDVGKENERPERVGKIVFVALNILDGAKDLQVFIPRPVPPRRPRSHVPAAGPQPAPAAKSARPAPSAAATAGPSPGAPLAAAAAKPPQAPAKKRYVVSIDGGTRDTGVVLDAIKQRLDKDERLFVDGSGDKRSVSDYHISIVRWSGTGSAEVLLSAKRWHKVMTEERKGIHNLTFLVAQPVGELGGKRYEFGRTLLPQLQISYGENHIRWEGLRWSLDADTIGGDGQDGPAFDAMVRAVRRYALCDDTKFPEAKEYIGPVPPAAVAAGPAPEDRPGPALPTTADAKPPAATSGPQAFNLSDPFPSVPDVSARIELLFT